MTKAELIEAIADAAGVSKADAERTVGAFFDIVVANTKGGNKVAWPGFGSFSTTKRPARTGRNPQTGAPVADCSLDRDEVHGELHAEVGSQPEPQVRH